MGAMWSSALESTIKALCDERGLSYSVCAIVRLVELRHTQTELLMVRDGAET